MMKLGLRAIGTGFLASLVTPALTSECVAAPPENVTPDPELQKWFEALRRPRTGHLRCSVIDYRIVVCAIRDGHCEVQINGRRYAVPNAVIIQGLANPADNAVACHDIGEFGPPLAPGHSRDQQQDTIEMLMPAYGPASGANFLGASNPGFLHACHRVSWTAGLPVTNDVRMTGGIQDDVSGPAR
jgi:hypothetical protein